MLSSCCVPGPVLGSGMTKRVPAFMELTFQSGEAGNTQATKEALLEKDKLYDRNKIWI